MEVGLEFLLLTVSGMKVTGAIFYLQMWGIDKGPKFLAMPIL